MRMEKKVSKRECLLDGSSGVLQLENVIGCQFIDELPYELLMGYRVIAYPARSTIPQGSSLEKGPWVSAACTCASMA